MAGIYGVGRSPLENLKAGTAQAIDKPGHVFSRIHVHDIAQILAVSMQKPNAGEIYNVADDEPSSSLEVLKYAANLAGIPCPLPKPFNQAILSPMLQGFYNECRRVSNTKIKQDLDIQLIFPSCREGLVEVLSHWHEK